MTFEFLIVCHATPEADLSEILVELLSQALENSQDEFRHESIYQMIRITHERSGDEAVNDRGETTLRSILGFTLELPEMDSAEVVVNQFARSLSESIPILHAVSFEDFLLQDELAKRAAEIFALEMKLRRVLSFIYLHAYQHEDPYNLLKEDQVRLATPELNSEQMASATENEFFHIDFSQYTNLNQRRTLQLANMLNIISDSEQYDALRYAIIRKPIENEQDTDFLNNLKALIDPIERMRNCVAHNRRPTQRIAENYHNAHPRLEELLDSYLADFST